MNEDTDTTGQVIIEENKLAQLCPEWVKISEIPHPALVPGFISRRECLPDGSIDPNTPSVTTQMILLQASNLSPSLAGVVGSIPSGLMCESIHRRQVKEAKEEGKDYQNEGFVITHPPSHYMRASDPMLIPSNLNTTSAVNNPMANNAVAIANQTASELAAMNLLYGGVRGRAYLDSLKSFIDSVDVQSGSKVEKLLKEKLVNSEGACGFKILNLISEPVASDFEIDWNASLIDQNHQICRLLKDKTLEESKRKVLIERLQNNLKELMKECPEEIRTEKFKGVNIVL